MKEAELTNRVIDSGAYVHMLLGGFHNIVNSRCPLYGIPADSKYWRDATAWNPEYAIDWSKCTCLGAPIPYRQEVGSIEVIHGGKGNDGFPTVIKLDGKYFPELGLGREVDFSVVIEAGQEMSVLVNLQSMDRKTINLVNFAPKHFKMELGDIKVETKETHSPTMITIGGYEPYVRSLFVQFKEGKAPWVEIKLKPVYESKIFKEEAERINKNVRPDRRMTAEEIDAIKNSPGGIPLVDMDGKRETTTMHKKFRTFEPQTPEPHEKFCYVCKKEFNKNSEGVLHVWDFKDGMDLHKVLLCDTCSSDQLVASGAISPSADEPIICKGTE